VFAFCGADFTQNQVAPAFSLYYQAIAVGGKSSLGGKQKFARIFSLA